MKIDVTGPKMSINMTQEATDTLGTGIAEIIDTIPATEVLHPSHGKIFTDLAQKVARHNGDEQGKTTELIEDDLRKHFQFLVSGK